MRRPDLVVRQAHHEVLTAIPVALILSLSKDEGGSAPPLRHAGAALRPSELVLDADDVVFAEIGAGLDLDQLEQDLAGVGEAVDAAERQVDRLVLGAAWSPCRRP